MRPIDQTKFGAPHGNCFAAAIASITGIPIDDFPDLSNETAGGGWLRRTEIFLRARGWELLYIPNAKGQEFQPVGHHVGAGMSPRGLSHACVFLDGSLAHDPHPSRAGIASVDKWYLLFPKPEAA